MFFISVKRQTAFVGKKLKYDSRIHDFFYWLAKPSRNLGFISWVFLFSVSVKVLPVTPLLSGGFVHRAFCAYFLRIERVVGNA